MSASVRTVPAQAAGWGRFPTALAALALVVLLAVMVAIVALNGTKASTPAATSGFGHGPGDWYYTAPAAPAIGAPPAAIDHHEDIGTWKPSLIPGGFGGPRLQDESSKYVPSVITDDTNPGAPTNVRAGHNGTRRAQ
jgi:hypothetical protein